MDLGLENGVETALYLADELTLTDRLSIYVGLRFSSFFALGPTEVRTYTPGIVPCAVNNITGRDEYC